jgi:uncharacterized protein
MFLNLLDGLKRAGLPVSITEYLALIEAVEAGVAEWNAEDFYYLSRAILVKDERNLDRFDVVFCQVFEGLEGSIGPESLEANIPEEWLRSLSQLMLTEEEKANIQALGWDALMDTLRKRLEEQKGRHEGGRKWIGTKGRSPFGSQGYNPAGVRIGQGKGGHRSAVKVWGKREYRNLDDSVELGTRNIKMALRRLRRFARDGAATELDMDETIQSTAHHGGLLDLRMRPERHNAVKVLLLLDAGGSMNDHVTSCAELFSACRTEFKHLESYYFHNCIYDFVWKDNSRRHTERIPTLQVLHKYPPDYKLIIVGDASMSPYEISFAGGSAEHWNEESGEVWVKRMLTTWSRAVWLNPVQECAWSFTESVSMVRQLMDGRMYPLTLRGLDRAIAELTH